MIKSVTVYAPPALIERFLQPLASPARFLLAQSKKEPDEWRRIGLGFQKLRDLIENEANP